MKKADLTTRHFIKKKELNKINNSVSSYYGTDIGLKKMNMEKASAPEFDLLIVKKIPILFSYESSFYLTLKGLLAHNVGKKYVTVDMGAVSFLTNGADVMSPGIVDADAGIVPGNMVWMRDEKNLQPLVVGLSLMSGMELKASNKGKGVKSIHYIGDELWNLEL